MEDHSPVALVHHFPDDFRLSISLANQDPLSSTGVLILILMQKYPANFHLDKA